MGRCATPREARDGAKGVGRHGLAFARARARDAAARESRRRVWMGGRGAVGAFRRRPPIITFVAYERGRGV